MKELFICMLSLVMLITACGDRPPETNGPSSIPGSSSSAVQGPEEGSAPAETTTPGSSVPADTSENTTSAEAPEEQESVMTITINGKTFRATLCDNQTAAALKERLPMTLDMSELNGNEKYNYFSRSLPTNASNPRQIHAGDLMLYGSDCLVLFYESFSTSYRYTPVGRIDDPSGLAEAVGAGSVSVSFALGEP